MPRGLSAAKPDMISAIQSAILSYVENGSAIGASPQALANTLGAAIGNAVHDYVKAAKVQADIGSGNPISANFAAPAGVLGGPFIPNPAGGAGTTGAPILTRPGTGKLT